MPTSLLPSIWTLSCQGVTVAAAGAGVTGITRHRASQTVDVCTLRFDGRAFDAAPPFAHGATVTVARGGVTWFVGRVTAIPASGDAKGEDQVCELSGPWWHLAQLVCQQPWIVQGGAATAWTSRLVLGQAADGSVLTTGQVIGATLQYAIDAGAPFAIGVIEPAFAAPFDEVKDVTCAEVIQKMLKWHPDCVAWFDYTTAPVPTFHCRARGSLPAATLSIGAPPLAAVRGLTARHDLQVPAVVLHYEEVNQVDGQAQTAIVTDAAPPGATGREFGAVVGTIPLRGEAAVTFSQRIVTQPVVANVSDPGMLAQLLALSPALAGFAADPAITADGIAITALARNAAPTVTGDVVSFTPAIDTALGHVLLEGQITDWMVAHCGVAAQTQRLTFTYTLDRGHGDGDTPPDVSAPQQASIDAIVTNAASGTYTTRSSYRPGDTAPTAGLAAACLSAWSALQYSGSIVLIEPEAGGVPGAGLGGVLNLTGGAVADWATMRAAVVGEIVQVAGGITTLTLGPSGSADVAGLAAALQTTRAGVSGRVAGSPASAGTASSASRATGKAG